MRLVGCLLLPTDIRACLYEPGMGEGRVQAWIEARARAWQAHHAGEPARPLVVVETSRGHCVVHSYRLIRQHSHWHSITSPKNQPTSPLHTSFLIKILCPNSTVPLSKSHTSLVAAAFLYTGDLQSQSPQEFLQFGKSLTTRKSREVAYRFSRRRFQLSNKRPFYFRGRSFTGLAIHRGKVTHSHPLNKYSGHISVFTRTWLPGYCPLFTYGTRGRLSKTVACVPLLRPRTCNWNKARAPNATLSHSSLDTPHTRRSGN